MANTTEGKNISSKNATKHGCCADSTLILKNENLEDFQALEAAWFETYEPGTAAEKHMVQELILADWFLQRANRTVAHIEAELMDETPNPLHWTDPQHKTFNRFLRYQTTRSNTFNRCRKAIEDFFAKREAEAIRDEQLQNWKEKNKPEPTIDELIDAMMPEARLKSQRDRMGANQQPEKH
jgi:hypothetical protein